jgi:hypothetical protein
MSNEAWFVKAGYTYVPCQWRAYAFMFVSFAALVGSLSLFLFIDAPWAIPVSLGSFVALSVLTIFVADRHSRKA